MIVLVAHNIRSTHNIGSLLRTCDGLGVEKVYLTGYTPYPKHADDRRLPHLAEKINKDINKTALGAEKYVDWEYADQPFEIINYLKTKDFEIIGLEQTANSINLAEYTPGKNIVLIIGEEVDGMNRELIEYCDKIVEIPMKGKKESLNVSIATAIALYTITSVNKLH